MEFVGVICSLSTNPLYNINGFPLECIKLLVVVYHIVDRWVGDKLIVSVEITAISFQ